MQVILTGQRFQRAYPTRTEGSRATRPGKAQAIRPRKLPPQINPALFGKCAGDFLATYDDAESVRGLAKRHGFDTELVSTKNTHHFDQLGLLICRVRHLNVGLQVINVRCLTPSM